MEKNNNRKPRKLPVLKINKYEYPQNVSDLVAHICSAKGISLSRHYEPLRSIKDKLSEAQYHPSWNLKSLEKEIDIIINKIDDYLVNDGESVLTVGVGGGYSSGKSSLLNMVTDNGDALPTGIEPVSIINTYLNCRKNSKKIKVTGRNFKNNLVALEPDVLQCIKHGSSSNVHVSSVLNDLILEVGVAEKPYLDNITFVDTPGYNNSDKKNDENNQKDEETAKKALNNCDLVIWCVDIEAGTVSSSDIKFLKSINKPWALFFTKMDKKPEEERITIIEAANKLCKKQLTNPPIRIVGIAPARPNINPIVLFPNNAKGYTNSYLEEIITECKPQTINVLADLKQSFDEKIDSIFELIESNKNNTKENIKNLKKEKKEVSNNLTEEFKKVEGYKKDIKNKKKEFQDFFVGKGYIENPSYEYLLEKTRYYPWCI